MLLSFPQGTKMFQFPWYASSILWIQTGYQLFTEVGPPFGNPRIDACLRLPEAYRCLPRPSSAPRAKASTVRP